MRNLTTPHVTATFEGDLVGLDHDVSIRYKDTSGVERSLTGVRLVYKPYIVGVDGRRWVEVPLTEVAAVDVDRRVPVSDFKSETHLVATWRRAPWGELIRFRPE